LIHKTAKPSTYPCKLCMVTFNGATMNKIWKQYISTLDIRTVFLHSDEFKEAYPKHDIPLPTVLLDNGSGTMKALISSNEFKDSTQVTELIQLLKSRL